MIVIAVTIAGKTFEIELESLAAPEGEFTVVVDGRSVEVLAPLNRTIDERNGEVDWLVIDRRPYEVILDRDFRWIKSNKGLYFIEMRDREAMAIRPHHGDGRIKAPIPGLVTRILVSEGDEVIVGQTILVLEAMKMENEIRAAQPGIVKTINVTPGQGVALHEVLAEIL